jgi:multimeric flavodoxin WrbA
MRVLVLDGSVGIDATSTVIEDALRDHLDPLGAQVDSVRIAEKHIGPCMGDFFCWTRSPGECSQKDDNRAIAQAFVQSDLVVFLSPVTFGGYSSALKRAIDHLIPTISPFFAKVEGETHHQKRYARYPRLLSIGWLGAPDPVVEGTFHHLVSRNALNLRVPNAVSGVVGTEWEPSRVRQAVGDWLDSALRGSGRSSTTLPAMEVAPTAAQPKRALLLIGSPRGKKSTSQGLGGYLFDRLEEQGIRSDTVRLYTVLKSEERRRRLLQVLDEVDLVALAFPVYVDCLPAPVISILEIIAAHRGAEGASRSQVFMALANCGFPEAVHNDTALAICATFAREAGFAWAGGLGLGGGQAVVAGVPLTELGQRGAAIRKSLDLAAEALAAGSVIPAEAVALMSRPTIPPWLYRILGGIWWRRQAKSHDAQHRLRDRPYG